MSPSTLRKQERRSPRSRLHIWGGRTVSVAAATALSACTSHGLTPPSASSIHESPSRTTAAATATVTAVIDGDTIKVRTADGHTARVRLLGIDAREIAHPRYGKPTGECGGQAARQAADELLYQQTVSLTTDPTQASTDRYGRWLRYVAVDGRDAQLALIRAGHAVEYHPKSVPAETRADQYERAEQRARARDVGQWAHCHSGGDADSTRAHT